MEFKLGDNLGILRELARGIAKLVYLDPPYKSGNKFSEFSDTFTTVEYLEFIVPRLQETHRLLREDGFLVIQCDDSASHYLKVELDKIFGETNFRNEVIWIRTGVHNHIRRGFGRRHDSLLFYAKSPDSKINPIYVPYEDAYIHAIFSKRESDGRRYALDRVDVPILTEPNYKSTPFYYELLGVWPPAGRKWAHNKEKMEQLIQDGFIYQRLPGKQPRRKRYLDESPGRLLQDVWPDCNITNAENEYPTQKPYALLERILKSTTSEGDLIIDPFAGSCTTLLAAKIMNREAIGIDINPKSLEIYDKRLSIGPLERIL